LSLGLDLVHPIPGHELYCCQLYPQRVVLIKKKKKQKEKGVEIWKTLSSLPHSHTLNNNKFFLLISLC